MTTEHWPCWTCKHRSDQFPSGEYRCHKPVTSDLALWELWMLENANPMWRALGTERQLRGETDNERTECQAWEAA